MKEFIITYLLPPIDFFLFLVAIFMIGLALILIRCYIEDLFSGGNYGKNQRR